MSVHETSDSNANVMFFRHPELLRKRLSVLLHLGEMSVSVMFNKNIVSYLVSAAETLYVTFLVSERKDSSEK